MRFGRRGRKDEAGQGEARELDALPAVGPFDESQVDLEDRDGIDLGSLHVAPDEGMDVQLQVDESTGEVGSVVLVGPDGALELRAFAASRGGGAWDELRPQIAAEVSRLGGTATERTGPFGAELQCEVPVQAPDGTGSTQPSRITGHEGRAWLLRATLHGPVAAHPEAATRYDEVIRQVVVRRGREALPPGAPLPLRLPPDARRVE